MANLDLTIVKIMNGDIPVFRIMQGDTKVWPSSVNFAIDGALTNVTSSVPLPTSVEPNGSFTTTLSANTSCILNQVSVTMGGVDITSTAYSNGVVTIAEVTDEVVITAVAIEVITFQDAAVKALCVQYWGGGVLTGEITPTEAASVHDLGKDKNGNDINEGAGPFYENTNITSFDEFIYFSGIDTGTGLFWKQINSNVNQGVRGRFASCSNLVSIKIPRMVTTNMGGLFYGCSSLKEVDLSNVYGFTATRAAYSFYGCTSLEKVVFPDESSAPTSVYSMFGTGSNGRSQVLEYIDLKTWDFSSAPTQSQTPMNWLMGCTGLKYLPSGMHNLANTQSFANNPLTHDSAIALLNSLATVTDQTITFAADTYNTLTAAEIAIGTSKGWTVASA